MITYIRNLIEFLNVYSVQIDLTIRIYRKKRTTKCVHNVRFSKIFNSDLSKRKIIEK